MTREISRFLPRLSLAPMVDVSFAPYRYLNRLISKSTVLYTPMLVDAQLLRATPSHRSALLAKFFPEVNHNQNEWEQIWSRSKHVVPGAFNGGLVAQISGSIPEHLINAIRLVEQSGFNAVNVNMGCPAESAQSGVSGAALMMHPEFVQVLRSMRSASKLPLSVKCRLGVNQPADYDKFSHFVKSIASMADIDHFIVHSRVAMLGMDTKKNLAVPPLKYDFAMRIRRELLSTHPRRHIKVEYNGGINHLLDALCRGWGLEPTVLQPKSEPIAFHSLRKNAGQLGSGALQVLAILEVARLINRGLAQSFFVNLMYKEPEVDGIMVGRLTMKEILFPAKYDALMASLEMLRSTFWRLSSNLEGKQLAVAWLQAWKADCEEARGYLELDHAAASQFQISTKLINEVKGHIRDIIPVSGQKSRRKLIEEYLEMAQSIACSEMQDVNQGPSWERTESYGWLSAFPQSFNVSVPEHIEVPRHEELPFLETRSKAALARFEDMETDLAIGPRLLHSKEWIAPLQSLCANYTGAGAGWRSKVHSVLTEVQRKAVIEKWRPLNSRSTDKERIERVTQSLQTFASCLESILLQSNSNSNEKDSVSNALESAIVGEEDVAEIIYACVGIRP